MNSTPDRKRWWVLLAMTGSLSMIMIDTTIIAVALPSIQIDLDMDENLLEWVVIAYVLVLASLMALGGHLGDLIGKPRAFIIGAIGFGIASLLCGLAWNGPSLVAFRILQGIAAIIMQPASSALVIGSFSPGERGKAMGVYAGIPILFLTIGPVIGGFITEYASWRYCFFINVPVAVGVALAAAIVKPHDVRRVIQRFDWLGVLLLGTGLPALILGIEQSSVWGWQSPLTIGLLIAGVVLLVLFVLVELRTNDPIVHLHLFKDHAFLGDALMLMLVQAAITGIMIFVGIYLQVVLGFSPGQAGAALMPLLIPVLFMVYFAGRTYDRVGTRIPATFGSVVLTIGLAILALGTGAQSYPTMAIGMLGIGLGVPFIQVPSNTDGMSRVEAERRGMASGVLQTFRQFGAASGLAIMAAVIAATQTIMLNRSDLLREKQIEITDEVFSGATQGNLEMLEQVRVNDPDLADEIASIISSGIESGVWTATAIAATIVVIAPLMLASAPGRKT